MSRHLASKQLSMYLDAEVHPDEAVRIERHLESCDECRARMQGLRRVIGGLQDLRPVSPPRGLGLELQKQLARATPPFGDRSPIDRHRPSRMLQPAVLGSLGIVLALAIIMLLFLEALEGHRQSGAENGEKATTEVTGEASAVVGSLRFRAVDGGWVESSINEEEAASARTLRIEDVDGNRLSPDARRALDRLDGELVLRLGDEVVRLVRD